MTLWEFNRGYLEVAHALVRYTIEISFTLSDSSQILLRLQNLRLSGILKQELQTDLTFWQWTSGLPLQA